MLQQFSRYLYFLFNFHVTEFTEKELIIILKDAQETGGMQFILVTNIHFKTYETLRKIPFSSSFLSIFLSLFSKYFLVKIFYITLSFDCYQIQIGAEL